jgi:hypothetical protein
MNYGFVLEVLRHEPGQYLCHVGYMDKIFDTKEEAIQFYDSHNPHMRSLNARNTFISDWDPETMLMYVIRDYVVGLGCTIPPFQEVSTQKKLRARILSPSDFEPLDRGKEEEAPPTEFIPKQYHEKEEEWEKRRKKAERKEAKEREEAHYIPPQYQGKEEEWKEMLKLESEQHWENWKKRIRVNPTTPVTPWEMPRPFEMEFNLQATQYRDYHKVPKWNRDVLVPMFLRHKDRFGPDFTVEDRFEIAIFSRDKKLQLRSNDGTCSCANRSSFYGVLEGKEFSQKGKFLHFHTLRSEEEFTFSQLEFLANKIQQILEEELGFPIIPPRIFLAMPSY